MKETIDSFEESVSEVNEKLKAIKGLFVQEARERKQFIMKGHGSLVPHFSSQRVSPKTRALVIKGEVRFRLSDTKMS